MRSLASFHPSVQDWFAEAFPGGPTRAQEKGWAAIAKGDSTLILAPTGSGKTLAAFLSALDRLAFTEPPPKAQRCRVVYISPMKALAVDVERNLQLPIAGIARTALRSGEIVHLPSVAVRSGDTPAEVRARMLRTPPDILVTTPESLFLMLTSRARETLASAQLVIVDEIHALAGTKRGAHLALSLERLEALVGRRLQRVGLSATQRPLDEVARFLGGGSGRDPWVPRPVTIVDAGARRAFDIRVTLPTEDMSALGTFEEPSPSNGPDSPRAPTRRRIWASLYPQILERVRSHRSTLVFVNSRRLAERVAAALNELAGEPLARAHHGSIAREERLEMEEELKAGRLRVLVATSSLELGIDMGAIDLVIQIETPPSVASGMQRIGRAGHHVEAVSRGILFPKHRADLLAAAALARAMRDGDVEATRVPENPLDVLAQQIVAMATTAPWKVDDLHALVRGAAPYATLSRAQLEGVLDMLSGRYPSDEFAELRPRLVWDRRRGSVRAREGVHRIVVSNAGTIPDRGLYGVFLAEGASPGPDGRPRAGRRVGELDEEMVFESREGEVFVLGASSWRIVEIARDRVLVVPAPGQPGKMPFWKADRGHRPVEQGARIGSLTRQLLSRSREAAEEHLRTHHGLDPSAAANLLQYLNEQRDATGAVPDDRTLVFERLQDEMGDFRICLLSPWGGRVHAPWALAVGASLAEQARAEGRARVHGRRDRLALPGGRTSAGHGTPPPRTRGCRGPRGPGAGWIRSLCRPLPRGGRPRPAPSTSSPRSAVSSLDAAQEGGRPPLGCLTLWLVSHHPRDFSRVPQGRLRPSGPGGAPRSHPTPRGAGRDGGSADSLALRGFVALRLCRQLPLRGGCAARGTAGPGALGRHPATPRAPGRGRPSGNPRP